MNHDNSHCLDFKDDCPKDCYRAELVRDLEKMDSTMMFPVTWTTFKDTDECKLTEKGEK